MRQSPLFSFHGTIFLLSNQKNLVSNCRLLKGTSTLDKFAEELLSFFFSKTVNTLRKRAILSREREKVTAVLVNICAHHSLSHKDVSSTQQLETCRII